ncbi:MAG: hypothetical protein LUH06_00095 [Oscillospiraceae bacterium]|nr:hypothetical protein [Oscillospiraceae bacterium]
MYGTEGNRAQKPSHVRAKTPDGSAFFLFMEGLEGTGALKPTMELLMVERFPDAALQPAEREKICEKNVKIEFFTTEIW